VQKCRQSNCFHVFSIRATGTCSCRVSTVFFKCNNNLNFHKFQNDSLGFFSIKSADAEALCAERQKNVDQFLSRFQLLILGWQTAISLFKKNNILGDAIPSVCDTV